MSTKLSAIASGGAVAGATDTLVAVRSGTTDVLVTPVALDTAQAFSAAQTFQTTITVGVASSATGQILLKNSANAFTVTIQAGTTTANKTYTWPVTDGSSGQALTTNGSGVLAFSTIVAGTDTQVLFNDAGALAGDSGFTFDKAAGTLKLRTSNCQLIVGASTDPTGGAAKFCVVKSAVGQIANLLGGGIGLSVVTTSGNLFVNATWSASAAVDMVLGGINSAGTARTNLKLYSTGATGVAANNTTTYSKVGGAIFDHSTDTSSASTDGTEDDLYSDTIPASVLGADNDKIEAAYCLITVSSATATRRIKAYFGGTLVLDSGTQTIASAGTVGIYLTVIRESSTVVRVFAELVITGLTFQPTETYTRITGLTLSNTQVLKLTGIAAGTGAASADIVAKLGSVKWFPAA